MDGFVFIVHQKRYFVSSASQAKLSRISLMDEHGLLPNWGSTDHINTERQPPYAWVCYLSVFFLSSFDRLLETESFGSIHSSDMFIKRCKNIDDQSPACKRQCGQEPMAVCRSAPFFIKQAGIIRTDFITLRKSVPFHGAPKISAEERAAAAVNK
jgi:hypothetical protein